MTVGQSTTSIPALNFAGSTARAHLTSGSEGVLSALTLEAMKAAAQEAAGELAASTVSVSLDMTGVDFKSGDVEFACTVDRQTRTLIFMHALVSSGSQALIKATAIFRLS